jgi:glycosyltransferase involved in cell wall biosynthesis
MQTALPADVSRPRVTPVKPIKVLLVYQDFGAMGGIERYILQAAQMLQAGGEFEPIIACCKHTPFYNLLKSYGFKVYGLPGNSFFSKSFRRSLHLTALLKLKKIADWEKPDIVHVHIGLMENLLFKLWGYPVVFTFHGYSSLYSTQGVTSFIKRWAKNIFRELFQYTANRLDALLFVSRAEQFRMMNEGYLCDEQTGMVLHNGVPVAALKTAAKQVDVAAVRAQWNIPQDAICIASINRLDANKNPLEFIRLAKRLSQEHPQGNLHFVIAGDGPLSWKVKAECAVLPNVQYMGHCKDVVRLLAASDLVVSTARQEGFGLGVVEAMATGTPCIAYASGGAREILETPQTSECLVPVDDFDTLVQTVNDFLQQKPVELALLQNALLARAAEFDSEKFKQRLESVYDHLLPKISVILPVYNGENSILRAARSVLKQSYSNLELIVVDDGSTDDTLEQLDTLRDSRLKIIQQPNQGVAVARNVGFQAARGDYIAFIDADDCWLKHKLSKEVQTIRRYTTPDDPACLVYSSYYAVDEQDRLMNFAPVYRNQGDLSEVVLEHEGIFLPSTTLVHRSVFEAVGGFRPGCYHEDRVFFIEACQQFPAYPTGQRLVAYRQTTSGRCRRVLRDYETALEAELSIVESLKDVLPDDTLKHLSARQMRNLLFRFLMYNYTAPAQTLYARMQAETTLPGLFGGNKGRLAKLSLATGINFLSGARLLVQAFTRILLMPWWYCKMRWQAS